MEFKLPTIQFQNLLKMAINFCVPELCENKHFSRKCRTMPQTVNRLPFIPEVQIRFQAIPFRICGKESDTSPGFRPSTVVSVAVSVSCHKHSILTLNSSIADAMQFCQLTPSLNNKQNNHNSNYQ